jgi:hypothetical protein
MFPLIRCATKCGSKDKKLRKQRKFQKLYTRIIMRAKVACTLARQLSRGYWPSSSGRELRVLARPEMVLPHGPEIVGVNPQAEVAQRREGHRKEAGVCRLLNDGFMESTEQAAKPSRHRIEIKLSEQEKALIVQGAELAGKGVSAFVRDAAERAARELISERQPKRR